jgi:chromosome segregation ATPase
MASDPKIELRVARLENDTNSIYELLSEIRSTQQEHSRNFESIDGRLESMDTRFESMDSRFDSIETTLAEVVRRLPEPS